MGSQSVGHDRRLSPHAGRPWKRPWEGDPDMRKLMLERQAKGHTAAPIRSDSASLTNFSL